MGLINMKKKEESSMDRTPKSREYVQAEKLAKQGDASARCNLGVMHLNGYEVIANPLKAKDFFLEASQQGCIDADYYLGTMYEQGFPGVDKDERKALDYFKKVIEARPVETTSAEGRTGNNEEKQAEEYFSRDVIQKEKYDIYTESAYRLGMMYAEGRGTPQNVVQALSFFMKAAKKSHKDAQFYLGRLYANSVQLVMNDLQAVRWFKAAAAEPEGHMEAQYYLGLLYEEGGRGNKNNKCCKNEEEARVWFLKAAQNGHKDARYRLAKMCIEGRGGKKDESEAIRWFIKAANQGHKKAGSDLNRYMNVCGVGAWATSKEVPKLIEAAKQVLGDDYEQDLYDMFHELWYEAIPPLKDEILYHYQYEIYPSPQSIPSLRLPGTVYLYIEEGILHYQVLKYPELCSGILNVGDGFNLDRLKDVSFSEMPPLQENIRKIYYRCNSNKTKCNYEVVDDNGLIQVGQIAVSAESTEEDIKQNLLEEIKEKYCLEKEIQLQSLEKSLYQQLMQKGYLEPVYEDRFLEKTLNVYNEILKAESRILSFLINLIAVLENEEFKEVFKEPKKFERLSFNYIGAIKELHKAQQEIMEIFKEEVASSSEVIDIVNIAYRDRMNFKNYYDMVQFLQSFHVMVEQESVQEKIESFCQKHSHLFSFNQLGNFPVLFTAQFMSRRKLLLETLAKCFRKKHVKFYELAPIFFAFNKLLAIIDKTQPKLLSDIPDAEEVQGRNNEAPIQIQVKLEKEKNKLIKIKCFELIKPIFRLLLLEVQQLGAKLILERFYVEKKEWINCLSALKNDLGDKPEVILIVDKIEKVKEDISEKNDLASLIACIRHFLTWLYPQLDWINVKLNENMKKNDIESFDQPQQNKPSSPKDRCISRMGNFWEKLSFPRQGEALPSLDYSTRDRAGSEGMKGKKGNSGMGDSEMIISSPGCAPIVCATSFFLDDKMSKVPSSDYNRKPLAQSCDGISRFTAPSSKVGDKRKLSSLRQISSLSLDDKVNKAPNLDGDTQALAASQEGRVPSFEGKRAFLSPQRSHDATSFSPKGDKVDKSANENSNGISGNFGLFNKLPSPRMRRSSKPVPNTNPLSFDGKHG